MQNIQLACLVLYWSTVHAFHCLDTQSRAYFNNTIYLQYYFFHIVWCNWYQFNFSGESPLDLNCAYNWTFVGWITMFFIIVLNRFNIGRYWGLQDITSPLSLSGRCGTAPKPLRGLWCSTLNLSGGCNIA